MLKSMSAFILSIGISVSFIATTVVPAFSSAASVSEDQKIEALFTAIRDSNASFIRNGEAHPAAEAVQHLHRKLESAGKSWFAPKRSEWTARMFIDKIASKSSMSGEDYFIRLPDGSMYKAQIWLSDKLKLIESAN